MYEGFVAAGTAPKDAWVKLSIGASGENRPVSQQPQAGKSHLDVDEAVAELIKNVQQTSIGKCATFVRMALLAGGVDIRPPIAKAKDYVNVLDSKYGFQPIAGENYVPLKGDVSVIQPRPGGNPAGHICMFSGVQWISDFKQHEMYSGALYIATRPPFRIFRP